MRQIVIPAYNYSAHLHIIQSAHIKRPRSTMDSMRVSEAPDTGSIPVEATTIIYLRRKV